MRVAICGGTSLGHALAAVLGSLPDVELRVLTRQPHRWSRSIRAIYLDIAEICGTIAHATDDPAEAITGADMVLVCVPFPGRAATLRAIAPHLQSDCWVGGIPGFAGFDWEARALLGPEQALFGLQRVPYVRKTISYGETVWISGIRPRLFLAALPASRADEAALLLERLLNIPTSALPNYLPVTLSASNAIFHPARLYAAFADGPLSAGMVPQFYEDWCHASSQAYLGLDGDIQAIAAALPADTSGAVPICEHFGASDAVTLTSRIRAIRALRDRALPVRGRAGQFFLDQQSHYVTEDCHFALPVLASVGAAANVETPWIDRVLAWVESERSDPVDLVVSSDGMLPTANWAGINSPSCLAERSI